MHTFNNPDEAWNTLRILVKPQPEPPPRTYKIEPPPQRRRRELVAGGEIRWKPVDKAAAMLLAKTQEINKPDYVPTNTPSEQSQKGKATPHSPYNGHKYAEAISVVSHERRRRSSNKQSALPHCQLSRQKKEHQTKMSKSLTTREDLGEMTPDTVETMAPMMVRVGGEKAKELTKLDGQLSEISAALRRTMDELSVVYREVSEFTREATNATRSTRMAAVSELTQLSTALRDVRKFFLGAEYEQEQRRLREFVELCERLKSLKDSGFLDAVSDTMLRLT